MGHYKDTVRKHLQDLINDRENAIMKWKCFNKAINERVIITSKRYNLSSKTPVLLRLAYVLSYVQGVSVISASYCSFFY